MPYLTVSLSPRPNLPRVELVKQYKNLWAPVAKYYAGTLCSFLRMDEFICDANTMVVWVEDIRRRFPDRRYVFGVGSRTKRNHPGAEHRRKVRVRGRVTDKKEPSGAGTPTKCTCSDSGHGQKGTVRGLNTDQKYMIGSRSQTRENLRASYRKRSLGGTGSGKTYLECCNLKPYNGWRDAWRASCGAIRQETRKPGDQETSK